MSFKLIIKIFQMKNYYKIACGLMVLLLLTFQSQAQISLSINLQEDGETYEVALTPDTDWNNAEALTATAQVTLVVPTGGFELTDLTSLHGTWLNNATVESPTENPDFTYLNIGLASLGTDAIPYQKDNSVTLFTFKNSGECVGSIALMENNDPFKAPNSVSANVGNQLTTLGSGNINAWTGNIGPAANCALPSAVTTDGEVTFVIDLLEDGETYQVSLESSQTWNGVHALTATAQITLVVPTGGFELVDLYSINGSWINNATILTPSENNTHDYINVGLSSLGTDAISYNTEDATVLFTFKNGGACTGDIELMESNDPFITPNSVSANVGNQITTLGSGNKNAWVNNRGIGTAACEECQVTEFVATCTTPIEPVVICVEFCDPSKAITNVTSTFDCSLTIVDDKCVRYTPTPGFETIGTDYLNIESCDEAGNCEIVEAEVNVSENCNGANNDVENDIEEVINAERLGAAYTLEAWDDFLNTLAIPTVITPNGDGINDILTITGLELLPTDFTTNLTVYSTKGQQIYTTNNLSVDNMWNGKLMNAQKDVSEGTYFYRLTVKNGQDELYNHIQFVELRK